MYSGLGSISKQLEAATTTATRTTVARRGAAEATKECRAF